MVKSFKKSSKGCLRNCPAKQLINRQKTQPKIFLAWSKHIKWTCWTFKYTQTISKSFKVNRFQYKTWPWNLSIPLQQCCDLGHTNKTSSLLKFWKNFVHQVEEKISKTATAICNMTWLHAIVYCHRVFLLRLVEHKMTKNVLNSHFKRLLFHKISYDNIKFMRIQTLKLRLLEFLASSDHVLKRSFFVKFIPICLLWVCKEV